MKRQSVRKAHSLWIVVALLWLGLILILASQSYKQQTIVPYLSNIITPKQLSESLPDVTIRYGSKVIRAKLQPYYFIEFLFRKLAHVFVYMMMALLCVKVLITYCSRIKGRMLLAFAICFLISVLDETIQEVSHLRTPSYADIVLDLAGVTCGLCLAAILWRKRANTDRSNAE